MHVRRKLVLSLTAIGLTTVLTACGGDSISVPDGNGGKVKVDNNGEGDIKIESNDGEVVGKTGSLPEGFPADEVPVVSGDIVSGVAINRVDEKGYSVTITPSGEEDLDTAVALLTAEGFSTEGTMDMGPSKTAQLSSGAWQVLVAFSAIDGNRTFTYTVVPVGS